MSSYVRHDVGLLRERQFWHWLMISNDFKNMRMLLFILLLYIIIVTIALWEKMPVPVTSIWLIAMYQNVNIILLINVSTGFMNQNPNKRIDRNMPTSKANLSSLINFINDIDTIHILIFSSYLFIWPFMWVPLIPQNISFQ